MIKDSSHTAWALRSLSTNGSFWGNIRRTLVSFRDRQLLSDELS
jgi:hypothetical protein